MGGRNTARRINNTTWSMKVEMEVKCKKEAYKRWVQVKASDAKEVKST